MSKTKTLDKTEEIEYDDVKNSRRVNVDGREKYEAGSNREEGKALVTFHREEWRSIPVRLDDGRIHKLREILKNGRKFEEVSKFAIISFNANSRGNKAKFYS